MKGRHFTLRKLVRDPVLASALGPSPALAIFRLAPQDYHRFHAPTTGKLVHVKRIPGEYYTVNPQAVNERLDVFTANTREVLSLEARVGGPGDTSDDDQRTVIAAVVAIGALLVGSIGWDKKPGEWVEKGEGLGYFKYGGSTVVCVFPKGVSWDEDLLKNSEDGLETLVRTGEKIGHFT